MKTHWLFAELSSFPVILHTVYDMMQELNMD